MTGLDLISGRDTELLDIGAVWILSLRKLDQCSNVWHFFVIMGVVQKRFLQPLGDFVCQNTGPTSY